MFYSSNGATLLWVAVAYQLMTSSNAQNNAPGYLGCYRDVWKTAGGRALRGDIRVNTRGMSVEFCFHNCYDDYAYAGVETGTECYCGNNGDYNRHGHKRDSQCREICPGNSNQYCGGHWSIAVYRISYGVCSNAIDPPDHGTREVTNPPHVSFNSDKFKVVGTRVRFECETGYILQGAETIECKRRGSSASWNGSVPTCTATSPLLPTTTADTSIKTTYKTIINPQEFKSMTGTIIGPVAGAIAVLIILLIIVTIKWKKRGSRSTDVALGSINLTEKYPDVTSGSKHGIPSHSGVVRPVPKGRNVTITSSKPAYEIPSLETTNMPRRPTHTNHQFTRQYADIVHEYADSIN